MKVKISILDDHPVILNGIKNMFENDDQVLVTQTWSDVTSFFESLNNGIDAEVLLLDVLLPEHNGDWVAQQLQKNHPEIKILAMSVLDSAISANTMLRLGALGYIMKHATTYEWKKAILATYNNEIYIEPSLAGKIISLGDGRTREASVKTTLSPREKEVLQLIASGKSKKEIAKALGISVNTVKQYHFNISLKLEVNSTAALVGHALRTGLAQ